MGLLGKLFEEVPADDEYVVSQDYEVEYVDEVDVDLDGVKTETLVDDIYDQNELSDKTKSIFKVEELKATLPQAMATETKRVTVKGILNSFGLTPEEVISDANCRNSVMSSALKKIVEECETSISQKESEIEEYKMEIERLEKEIAAENERLKISEETIKAEIKRVEDLVEFIGGE